MVGSNVRFSTILGPTGCGFGVEMISSPLITGAAPPVWFGRSKGSAGYCSWKVSICSGVKPGGAFLGFGQGRVALSPTLRPFAINRGQRIGLIGCDGIAINFRAPLEITILEAR